MKKIYFFIATAVLSTSAIAQVTIQSTGLNPLVGDAMVMHSCNYISEGSAGSGITWDLSGMSSNSSYILSVAAATGTTPNANIDLNYGGQSHMYQLNDASGNFIYNQLAGTTMITFSDPMKLIEFPLSGSTNFTDNFSATFTSSGYNFLREGTVSFTADSYGTLTTPDGTFTDVIRVEISQVFTDTYSLGTIDYDVLSYVWYKSGYHGALASVVSMTTSVSAPSSYSEYMEVSSLGVQENSLNSVTVYPNPVTNELNIELNETEINSISIVDLNGNTILNKTNSFKQINVSELNPGIYFVAITDVNGVVSTTKFSKN